MTKLLPKIGPKSRDAAKTEVHSLLKFIRDYTKYPSQRSALALREELHQAYCEANFGIDGDYVPSLDEADVLKCIADMIERDFGMADTTHDMLEMKANSVIR